MQHLQHINMDYACYVRLKREETLNLILKTVFTAKTLLEFAQLFGVRVKKKKTLEQEINEFLESWDCKQLTSFLRDIIPLFELYDVEDEDDWVKEAVGEENERNVRLIRTVYLVSKIAEFHAGKLCTIKINFKDLYKRMEKHNLELMEACVE